MFKTVHKTVWAYDVEWVPDPMAGRLLLNLSEDLDDAAVIKRMWIHGGATDEDPMPFLKMVMCRIVSIVAVQRKVHPDRHVSVDLLSMPRDVSDPDQAAEDAMIGRFLEAVGRVCPQLVGYNSSDADLKILLQRAVVNGLQAEGFCTRPDKPWEGVDYFARESEYNLDLMRIMGGWGRGMPSLNELATLSGIPGKMDVDGNSVAVLWLQGEHQRIVNYNEFDALTTYLLWLRITHLAGKFSTPEYEEEQERVRELLRTEGRGPGREHLLEYLEYWDALSRMVAGSRPARIS